MNVFLIVSIGFLVMCGIIWVTIYYTIGFRPIVVNLNDPKYKSMKYYDSYKEWHDDWGDVK